MLQLDFLTLYIVIILNSLTVCVIWTGVVATYSNFTPSRIWLASVILSCIGGAILSLQGNEGAFWPATIGNTIIIYSFCLLWIGIRYFYDEKSGWKNALIISLASFFFMAIFHTIWQGRNVVYAVGQSVPMALTAIFLFRQRRIGFGGQIAMIAILLGIGGHAIETALNLAAWSGRYDQDLYFAVESYALVCVIYGGIIWHFGFIVMAVNRLHGDIVKVAETDELTDLPNRRHFMGQLAQSEERFLHDGMPYSVMMIDIDHFKQWNDKYGHKLGDLALMHFARVASTTIRNDDILARTGGDEFALLMPLAGEAEATELARRLIIRLRCSPLRHADLSVTISASIGIAARAANNIWADIDVLARADMALYNVKKAGRDGYATTSVTAVKDDVPAFRVVAGGSSHAQ
ncbi:GGDEF domain-containing protein [Paracoccus methylarcula]|uniref:diguanylate cyclase n=1 Tax=Paracoccus methylarcula TaxID=72022 RepID=A0A422R2B3_9RHOB|nr:GGDEF domain-containing protein [Paracoccus methylarcula]RNF36379.1 GGDEF domain-containing protein [Paracoccus methylarcula]